MSAHEIVEKLSLEHQLTRAQGRVLVDALFAAILDTVRSGEAVSFPAFGTFRMERVLPRQDYNPSTGASIATAATARLVFVPALLTWNGQHSSQDS